MDITTIKELATKYSTKELLEFADQLEAVGSSPIIQKENAGEAMSDLLQAYEIRTLLDQGMTMQEALRTFSKRVREVLK